jgi:catechol 2,3-dioxygenase-like lactoylglutathione lyase family enzyme
MRVFLGVSSLTLGVRSVAQASSFYEGLGWRLALSASSPAISVFELNNLLLMLQPSDALERDTRGAPCRVALTQNYGSPQAVAFAMEQARLAGAKILRTATPETFGRRGHVGKAHGLFADPDGHVWEIVSDPRALPAPDGSVHP